MKDNPYKFHMQEISSSGIKPIKDLEKDFDGLRYLSCTGISSKGEPRIYKETFCEKNGANVFIPSELKVDSTDVQFVFAFVGNSRRDTFDSFYDYVKGKKIKYWDTARNREIEIVLSSKVEPTDDILIGSTPYIKATFKFTNIKGLSVKI